jgi:hypothetical protein
LLFEVREISNSLYCFCVHRFFREYKNGGDSVFKVFIVVAFGCLWISKTAQAELEFYPIKEENTYKYQVLAGYTSSGPYKDAYLVYKSNKYLDSNSIVRKRAHIDTDGDTTYSNDTCSINSENHSVHCDSIIVCDTSNFCFKNGLTMHPFYFEPDSIYNHSVKRTLLSGNGNRIMVFDTLLYGAYGTRIQTYLQEVYSDEYGLLKYNFTNIYGVGAWHFRLILVEFNGVALNVDALMSSATGIRNGAVNKRTNSIQKSKGYRIKTKRYLVNGRLGIQK